MARRGRSGPDRVCAVAGSDRFVFGCGDEDAGPSDLQRLRERGEQPEYGDISCGRGMSWSPEAKAGRTVVARRGRSGPDRVCAVAGSDRFVFGCGDGNAGPSDLQRLRERGEQPEFGDISCGRRMSWSPEENM